MNADSSKCLSGSATAIDSFVSLCCNVPNESDVSLVYKIRRSDDLINVCNYRNTLRILEGRPNSTRKRVRIAPSTNIPYSYYIIIRCIHTWCDTMEMLTYLNYKHFVCSAECLNWIALIRRKHSRFAYSGVSLWTLLHTDNFTTRRLFYRTSTCGHISNFSKTLNSMDHFYQLLLCSPHPLAWPLFTCVNDKWVCSWICFPAVILCVHKINDILPRYAATRISKKGSARFRISSRNVIVPTSICIDCLFIFTERVPLWQLGAPIHSIRTVSKLAIFWVFTSKPRIVTDLQFDVAGTVDNNGHTAASTVPTVAGIDASAPLNTGRPVRLQRPIDLSLFRSTRCR